MDNTENTFFGSERVSKILLKICPPVMFAQLIQALYNLVDSYFIGKCSEEGLTALSVIYPIQLIIIALGVGIGVGVNTVMARFYGLGEKEKAAKTAGTGIAVSALCWIVFALVSLIFMKPFANASSQSVLVRQYVKDYGSIVCVGSTGIFLEGVFSKIHQAKGNMKLPMIAQVCGALFNIVFDKILIFGLGSIPALGIKGAAYATVGGQILAAVITGASMRYKPPVVSETVKYTKLIWTAGMPSIVMQALYTVYILGLNLLLVTFSDAAVTVLGIYYKLQSLFFIPLFGMETCIVPVLSYNCARKSYDRCRKILFESFGVSAVFMAFGIIAFEFFPTQLIGLFSHSELVKDVGRVGFRIIASSFLPAAYSLLIPVFFQAVGRNFESVALTVLRQVILFVPLAWLLSFAGLNFVWCTFPITEILTCALGMYFYAGLSKKWRNETAEFQQKSKSDV